MVWHLNRWVGLGVVGMGKELPEEVSGGGEKKKKKKKKKKGGKGARQELGVSIPRDGALTMKQGGGGPDWGGGGSVGPTAGGETGPVWQDAPVA
ncbi:hypothetical protein GCM10020219_084400 [Nonomuraea dietziae]